MVEGTATLSAEPGSISVCGSLVTKSCPAPVTPWTVACQAPLSMGFLRQECWSGLPFPSPGDLLNLGIELMSLASPTLAYTHIYAYMCYDTHIKIYINRYCGQIVCVCVLDSTRIHLH